MVDVEFMLLPPTIPSQTVCRLSCAVSLKSHLPCGMECASRIILPSAAVICSQPAAAVAALDAASPSHSVIDPASVPVPVAGYSQQLIWLPALFLMGMVRLRSLSWAGDLRRPAAGAVRGAGVLASSAAPALSIQPP